MTVPSSPLFFIFAMSDQLNKAAQFRKHLMEMVAHDMRSPLSAVSLSLAVLDKSDGEKMEQEAKPLLTREYRKRGATDRARQRPFDHQLAANVTDYSRGRRII